MKTYHEWLEAQGACTEARLWSRERVTIERCWSECQRSDWMLWLLERLGVLDDTRARLFACWCVRNTPLADGRTTWDLLTDERSRTAVEVAERFAAGQATSDELDAALAAAVDAARAAAWAAAVYAAVYAAAVYAARAAALDAALAAAWAAAWAARAAALDAARAAAMVAQCSQIRAMWTLEEVVEAFKRANP
jgi:hypothetical protein